MEPLDFGIVKELVELITEEARKTSEGCVYGITILPAGAGEPPDVGWCMRVAVLTPSGRVVEQDGMVLDSVMLTANQALRRLVDQMKSKKEKLLIC
jgi:hypothetical protein